MKEEKDKDELKEELKNDPEVKRQIKLALMFSYGLHPKFFVHVLYTLLLNGVILSSLLGIPHFAEVKDYTLYGLGIVLFTFIEISIKIGITKWLQAKRLYSIGLIDLVVIIFLLYFSFIFTKAIVFDHVWKLVIYVVLFMVVRFILSYYIRKISYRKVIQ